MSLDATQSITLTHSLSLVRPEPISQESAGLLVGAISPNSDVALAIFPAVIVLNIIFDGKNISEENTPVLLRWIPKVGLIRWGFEGVSFTLGLGIIVVAFLCSVD
jgi:hypothetical protein